MAMIATQPQGSGWDQHNDLLCDTALQAKGAICGLSLATHKAALIRAILEGTVFACYRSVEVAIRAGIQFSEMRSVGGGPRGALWNQIKSEVLGMPTQLTRSPVGAAFGDALLTGLGLGLYPDFGSALPDIVKLETRHESNRENHLRSQCRVSEVR